MAKSSSPIPKGYNAVNPYLRIKGAADAIAFYKKAFGATERFRLPMGDRLGHAAIQRIVELVNTAVELFVGVLR